MKISAAIVSLPLFFGIAACKSSANSENEKVSIPFTGQWERKFNTGPDNVQHVVYSVFDDSIRYTMTGLIQSDYLLKRDTFILSDNRFIGHDSDDRYFLIFVKEFGDSLSLYKQEVEDSRAGLSVEFPSDSVEQAHFGGWNTFHKK